MDKKGICNISSSEDISELGEHQKKTSDFILKVSIQKILNIKNC